MIKIIDFREAPDGWDAEIIRNNGKWHIFHFPEKPENTLQECDRLDSEMEKEENIENNIG